MVRRLLALSAAAAAIAGGVAGLGDGPPSLGQDRLEREVRSAARTTAASRPKDVRCPAGVRAEAGATTRCLLIARDDRELDAALRVRTTAAGRPAVDVRFGRRDGAAR